MSDEEYIPPASAGVIVPQRAVVPRESRRQRDPFEVGARFEVIVRFSDGREVRLRDCLAVKMDRDFDYGRDYVRERIRVTLESDDVEYCG